MLILAIAALLSPAQNFSVSGPGFACGSAFAIQLRAGETLSWTDHNLDAIVYRFRRPNGVTTIYAGNFPQPGGIVFETRKSWPEKVVVHDTAEIAQRVVFDTESLAKCQAKGAK